MRRKRDSGFLERRDWYLVRRGGAFEPVPESHRLTSSERWVDLVPRTYLEACREAGRLSAVAEVLES